MSGFYFIIESAERGAEKFEAAKIPPESGCLLAGRDGIFPSLRQPLRTVFKYLQAIWAFFIYPLIFSESVR